MAYTGIFKTLPNQTWCAIGGVSGVETGFKYASSTLVSTSYVDVWPNASILSYLSSAEQVNLASTSPNDDLTGSGLEKVLIFGLDSNYDEISEEITLNGTSNVLSTNSYIRVYRMRGTQSNNGSNNTFNAGTITATAASSATVQAYMEIGTNNSLQSQFTVPNGKYLIATSSTVTVRSGDQANVRFFVREFGKVFTLRFELNIASQAVETTFNPPIVVPPKADITARAIKIAGGGTVGLTVSYDYFLADSTIVNI